MSILPVFTRLSRLVLNSHFSPEYILLHGPMLVGAPRAKHTVTDGPSSLYRVAGMAFSLYNRLVTKVLFWGEKLSSHPGSA